tara:strand:+ start:16 stop:798 length:783 start_codon:yes stop_codon:yes gene_type:complete
MKVLIACEESQSICKEFRKLGHEAYSCDLLPCSGGNYDWHFQDDAIEVMNGWFDMNEVTINNNFALKFDVWSGNEEFEYKEHRIRQVGWNWDLMIAHPPCTYLAVSGNRWLYNKDGSKNTERWNNQAKALDFVKALMSAPIKRIAIENPISVISSEIRKPDQIVQPWMFGDEAQKSTCLWLKNLPLLKPTNIVGKGEFIEFIGKDGKKKKQPKWYFEALQKAKTPEERRTLRSKTFPGMAKAIAEQWSDFSNYIHQTKLF